MRVSTNCPSMASPTTFNGSPSVSVPTAPGKVAHSVEATGLTANTAYCYQVGDGQAQNWSPVYNFRTGPPSGTSFSFIHVTDAHPGRTDNPTAYGNYVATDPVWTNTLAQALVKSPNASLIVSTGDQVDDLGDGSRSDQEDNYYYFTKPPQLRNLILAPTMGNHDNNTAPFSKHFNLPNNPPGITTGASPSSVYSFTRGNALFLVINTEIPANNMATLKTWLTNTATASSAKWKIVLLHKSLYPVCNHYGTTSNPSVPAENYRGELVPVFDSLSIDLVLMGHDHCLVRTWVMKNDAKVNETFNGIYSVNPGGTVYLELPGAALKQYPINPSASGTTFTAVKVGGDVTTAAYNIIDVTSTRLTINTYKASDNSVLDTYGIEKP